MRKNKQLNQQRHIKNRWRDSQEVNVSEGLRKFEFFSGPLGGEAMIRVPLCPELDKQGRKWVNLRLIARRKRNQKLARETALTQAKREQNARYSKTGPRYWKAHFAAVWPRRVFCLLITSCFFFFSFHEYYFAIQTIPSPDLPQFYRKAKETKVKIRLTAQWAGLNSCFQRCRPMEWRKKLELTLPRLFLCFYYSSR